MAAETNQSSSLSKRGGWTSFPFIIGATWLLNIATAGTTSNLIVYLIDKFNIDSIDAAQVFNFVNGCINLVPMAAAIIADSFLGCFSIAAFSSVVSFLGIVLLTLTAIFDSLRPHPICSSPQCPTTATSATPGQLAVLYASLTLAAIGTAGFWFTLGTIGANQFHRPEHQSTFFNWYLFAKYAAYLVATTAIVYIQDSVSWGLGFGLCAAANLVGVAVLLLGKRFYYLQKPEGSPFTSLAQVIVASIKKKSLKLTSNPEDYYQYGGGCGVSILPGKGFRFLNRAALKTEGDTAPDSNSITKPWRLCSVQQVEDLKTLIKIFPIWSSGIFLTTPITVQTSATILQALAMDRSLGPHFKIPAGSVLVVTMLSGCISIALIDRLSPLWSKLTGSESQSVKPLRKVGVGHVVNALSMAVSALVEWRRLHVTGQMSVLWLFPQLILVSIGEAFHFPGQVAFYYQEFPASLKTSATAMLAMVIGIAFYLGSAVISETRKLGWLKSDINKGRLDIAYWMLAALGLVNFAYYLVCANLYKYKPTDVGLNNGKLEDEPIQEVKN